MKKLFSLLIVCFIPYVSLHSFEKVVIWGHKLHSHTHSYIHHGFYKAFVYLGYPTYWFDNADDTSQFDFSDSLFITEGQVDEKIPLRNDCTYILHNCDSPKYKSLDPANRFYLQVYTDDVLKYKHLIKLEPFIYCDRKQRCLYMPWATDLLPEEIEANKQNLSQCVDSKLVYWIGTIGGGQFGNIEELQPFKDACQNNDVKFIAKPPRYVSLTDSVELIRNSYLAPAIVGSWQKSVGYIPCRIFKNISYGKMGLTNSRHVYELFEGKIVYNPDTYKLFYDGKERLKTLTIQELHELMDFVKTKHTYVNRIRTILSFIQSTRSSEVKRRR